jgi:hypothetical protein
MRYKENKNCDWFENVFLQSFEEKFKNRKYPNQVIITPAQENICYKYMNVRECHGDYGFFNILEYVTDKAVYQVTYRGKYVFLNKRTK